MTSEKLAYIGSDLIDFGQKMVKKFLQQPSSKVKFNSTSTYFGLLTTNLLYSSVVQFFAASFIWNISKLNKFEPRIIAYIDYMNARITEAREIAAKNEVS